MALRGLGFRRLGELRRQEVCFRAVTLRTVVTWRKGRVTLG